MIKNKLPIVSLILYILAGLLFIFAIWAAVLSFQIISEAVAMGQVVVRDAMFEILGYLFASFGQYVVYAALLFAAGWIVYLVTDLEVVITEDDDEEEDFSDMVTEVILDEVEEE
jgi:hypothetical protein